MKYMGSKNRIAKEIMPIIIGDTDNTWNYWEPFCGGCNTIKHIPNDGRRICFSDVNRYLIEMWKGLMSSKEYPATISREFYSDVRKSYRANDGRYSDDLIGWVGFMASCKGRFFDGGYSGHNVSNRDYIAESIRNIKEQIKYIQGDVSFKTIDYKSVDSINHCVIYCDPPYKDTKQYSNTINHNEFWEWCRKMANNGNKVFVSEYNAPDDFRCIWEKQITNAMATQNTYSTTEKLFTYGNN